MKYKIQFLDKEMRKLFEYETDEMFDYPAKLGLIHNLNYVVHVFTCEGGFQNNHLS